MANLSVTKFWGVRTSSLSGLMRGLEEREYRIYGYKGKQVRDNIHSRDVTHFIHEFAKNPQKGEVYNLGGGKANSCSILEAFALVERFTGKRQRYAYVPDNRIGDHICYYSDLRKMRARYPRWDITIDLEQTIREIVDAWRRKLAS
jgi:CDP-paratose 2-epimerase